MKDLINYFNKQLKSQEVCSEKGHIGEKVTCISSYHNKTTASCYCKACGSYYSRRATQEEINNFNKVVNEPFTI